MTTRSKTALLLLSLVFASCGFAQDSKLLENNDIFSDYSCFDRFPPAVPSSVSYCKVGVGAPVDTYATIPAAQVGIGQRYRVGAFGADGCFSANYMNALLVLDTAFELQGHALLYSHPQSDSSLFCGLGGGYAWRQHNSAIADGSPEWREFPTANALIGYEFNRFERFQQFLQIELMSQVAHVDGWPSSMDTPSIVLSTGLTF